MFLIFIFAIIAQHLNGARILGIIPTPSYSHQIPFQPLWRELSLRGHNVTTVTTDPINAPELTNLTQIDVGFAYKYVQNFHQDAEDMTSLKFIPYIHAMRDNISDAELSHPKVQQLIKTKEKFDLVIIEIIYPHLLAFGEIFKCPTILVSSFELQSLIHMTVGNPSHPVLYPEHTIPLYGELSFKERIFSTIYQVGTNLFVTYKAYPEKHKIAIKHFGRNFPSIMDMLKKASLILVATDPVLCDVRALGPMMIAFGRAHLQPPQPLPKVIF